MYRRLLTILILGVAMSSTVLAKAPATRPVFQNGYVPPEVQMPLPSAPIWPYIDVGAMVLALSLTAYFVHKKRSRRAVFVLACVSLLYFGFYRKGCICSVGSIQNVAVVLGNSKYALPWSVAAYYALPLLFAIVFGRVFCAGVCPLGMIQDVVHRFPIRIPGWLSRGLTFLASVYLGLAVLLAASGGDYIICRYDPFISLFRLDYDRFTLWSAGIILGLGIFVGRIYCRFLCPYSVLLKIASAFTKWPVKISATACINCRACMRSCPYNAVIKNTKPKDLVPVNRTRRWAVILVLLLILPVGGAWAAHHYNSNLWDLNRPGRKNATIRQTQVTLARSNASSPTPLSDNDLEQDAVNQTRSRFATGSAIFGGWVGLAGVFSIGAPLLRKSRTYCEADAGNCLSCGRCYPKCPVNKIKLVKLGLPREPKTQPAA